MELTDCIREQLTNNLYRVSLNDKNNILYINTKSKECHLVFKNINIELNSLSVRYDKQIGDNNIVILEFYSEEGHSEVLLKNGILVHENKNNLDLFYEVHETFDEDIFSYQTFDNTSNLMNIDGENILSHDSIYYISTNQNRYIVVGWYDEDEIEQYNLYDLTERKFVMHSDDYMKVCDEPTNDNKDRIIVIRKGKCFIVDIDNNIISSQINCEFDTGLNMLLNSDNNDVVDLNDPEEYIDLSTKRDSIETPHDISNDSKQKDQIFKLPKENGVPKQIALNIESDGSYSIKVTY